MRKLVVISVDSLFTSDLEAIKDIPGFQEVINDSIIVKDIECIYPTVTYPCHATIMTGHYPDQHGIMHNEVLAPEINNANWYWYYEDLKVKTIFDYAKESGLTTAAVLWPVTANADIDYVIPEIWSTAYDEENKIVAETSSANVRDIYYRNKHLLNWKQNPAFDNFAECCLLSIIDQFEPDVAFLHQATLDYARHVSGIHHEFVDEAHGLHGRWIKNIFEMYQHKGLFENTTFIILGDHGQLDIQNVISINEMLRRKGLIKTDGEGKILSYDAYMQSAGISGHLYIKNKACLPQALEVLEEAKEQGYIERIFNKQEARDLHLAGDFEYVVEGGEAISLSNNVDCEIVSPVDTKDYKYAKATHGHLPNKGDKPVFMIYNSGLPARVIESGRLIDEFPTFMKILGLEMPEGIEGRSFI